MRSIRQNVDAQSLPDFGNVGVILRIVLGTNALALAAALAESARLQDVLASYVDLAPAVQPPLLMVIAVLALLARRLKRLRGTSVWFGRAVVVLLAVASATLVARVVAYVTFAEMPAQQLAKTALVSALAASLLLFYFSLRTEALAPALSEARAQALTARIRPHFLFNSLTAVLSLMRTDPQRAEVALEELAELFRALMRDHRALVPLSEEIALCRQYLDLEKLRLGDRLQVQWVNEDLPCGALVPPLLVQPLLENAVYHGVEPLGERCPISVLIARRGSRLLIELTNACESRAEQQHGNRMALDNIRERLALHYDLEARLEAGAETDSSGRCHYRVRMVLPCEEGPHG